MIPLDLIPAPYRLAGGALIAASVLFGAWSFVRSREAAADAAGYARGHAELVAYRDQAQRAALEEASRRQAMQAGIDRDRQEISDEMDRIRARDHAADLARAGRLAGADQRLQQHLDAAAGAAGRGGLPGGAGTVGGGKAYAAQLADILGACRRALGQLERDADAEVDAVTERHQRCAAEYGSVRARINALGQGAK